jgi:RNA-directed DNA polymerase
VGGKGNTRGTPQGSVPSPLLANIYMNWFLQYWRLTGPGEAFRAHVVSYSDDFLILSRGPAAEALAWTKATARCANCAFLSSADLSHCQPRPRSR